MASDIDALRKWKKLDKSTQKMLLTNVFCPVCFVTTIIDYEITSNKFDIVLRGKCKQCGHAVARVVEDEWFNHESM